MPTNLPTQYDDAELSKQEDALLREALAGQAERLLLRSTTRIDTGRCWRRSAVWLCMTDERLLLLAASKRRYLEQMPLRKCKGTQYCHTTGALLLQPSDHWRFNTIALPPVDALKVLKHIEHSTEQPIQEPPVTEPTVA